MKGAFAFSGVAGFQSRSLNWQRRAQARERTSDGQPENTVGRFCAYTKTLKHPALKYELWCTKLSGQFWLTHENAGPSSIFIDCPTAIAGKPDSHRFSGVHNVCRHCAILWERACPRWRTIKHKKKRHLPVPFAFHITASYFRASAHDFSSSL
jgi:hypothetical protein